MHAPLPVRPDPGPTLQARTATASGPRSTAPRDGVCTTIRRWSTPACASSGGARAGTDPALHEPRRQASRGSPCRQTAYALRLAGFSSRSGAFPPVRLEPEPILHGPTATANRSRSAAPKASEAWSQSRTHEQRRRACRGAPCRIRRVRRRLTSSFPYCVRASSRSGSSRSRPCTARTTTASYSRNAVPKDSVHTTLLPRSRLDRAGGGCSGGRDHWRTSLWSSPSRNRSCTAGTASPCRETAHASRFAEVQLPAGTR